MTAICVDINGNSVPVEMVPEPCSADFPMEWEPFDNGTQFELGDFIYRKVKVSAGNINKLMDLWGKSMHSNDNFSPFESKKKLYASIDAIQLGDAPWHSFKTSFSGKIGANPPIWQITDYEIWYCDPSMVIKNPLNNPDLDGTFDYTPYIELDSSSKCHWNEYMSGNFACTIKPILAGADKTTTSVATGNVEYHPLYLTLGNVHNTMCCAHQNAVIPIGLLTIPKSDQKDDNNPLFCHFKHQLYHATLATILKPLH
ncbi:hypothetical protein CVT25_000067 [Psilocybe cyanescens]|uniref:Uncharacterized protein n=1 Tax=Psilocybe cyanescens TaxID=93625 RepID=A0A409XEK4_PSICY|nr:hypothetical protein CVT25_000067 [Psilocybe cyanescens]